MRKDFIWDCLMLTFGSLLFNSSYLMPSTSFTIFCVKRGFSQKLIGWMLGCYSIGLPIGTFTMVYISRLLDRKESI